MPCLLGSEDQKQREERGEGWSQEPDRTGLIGEEGLLPGQLQVWGQGTQREEETIHWGQFSWDMLGQESHEMPRGDSA